MNRAEGSIANQLMADSLPNRVEARPPDVAEEERCWQEALLTRVRYMILGLIVFTACMLTFWSRTENVHWLGIAMLSVTVPLFLVLKQDRIPLAARAWLVILCVCLMATASYVVVGFNPGPPLGLAFCLVLAALLLGTRATIVLGAIMSVVLAAMVILLATGVWQGPAAAESNTDDLLIWFRTSVVTIVLLAGIATCVLFVVGNIERTLRQREATLEQLYAEIKQRRAAEVAKNDAESVALHAQKLNAMGQLAAGIAHDFNNALLVIMGWNDMLKENDSPELKDSATDSIADAGKQAAGLARQLLNFSHKEERSPELLDLSQLVSTTLKTLERLLPSSISLHVETQPQTRVFADETQMTQLLYNLVINARDALPQGRGNIRVECSPRKASDICFLVNGHIDENWVHLAVGDDGDGIAEHVREQIFKPFFTTKPKNVGSGIGLSTAQNIVRQSGGYISVDSEVGQGACFNVYLPAAEAVERSESSVPAQLEGPTAPARVLVLESDSLARSLICYVLLQQGHHVVESADGNSAMRLLKNGAGDFDLLCAESIFPGAPITEVINAFERRCPDSKVLICSGFSREHLENQGMPADKHAFLGKPFNKSQLICKLNALLAA